MTTQGIARAGIVLLVEDDPSDVELVQTLLKKADLPISVRTLPDGVQAIEHLGKVESGAEERPLLVVLDLGIPPRGGWEILTWMREREALRDLPVTILTGSDDPNNLRLAKEWNDIPFLKKTFSYSGLDQLVRALLIDGGR